MKKLVVCLVVMAALAVLAPPALAAEASPWQLKNPVGPQRDLRADLKAVCALDGGTVWAAGAGAALYYSHDGGDSWEAQETGAPWWTEWRAVRFADRMHGLVLGQAAARPLLYRTEDGGRTWTPVALPSGIEAADLEYYGPERAWIVGARGLVLRSTDGGLTWQRLGNGGSPWGSVPAVDLSAVDFTSATSGVAVGAGGAVYRSGDGGRTWTRASVPTRAGLLDLVMRTPQAGWAVGLQGTVLATRDGGRSWQRQWPPPLAGDLVAVDFASREHGWAVSAAGALLVTTDGGRSWAVERHGMGALRLRDIDVPTRLADAAAAGAAAAEGADPDAEAPERAFTAGDGGAVGKYTEVGTESRTNEVWLVPETTAGDPLDQALTFDLTTIQYNDQQPYDGWNTGPGSFTMQGVFFKYFIIIISAGREDSGPPAQWFNTFCSSNEIGNGHSPSPTPSSLNFAFSGTLAANAAYTIAFGQGSDSSGNNWWVGGPGYSIVAPMTWAFPSITTPDSAWLFTANGGGPTYPSPPGAQDYVFIVTPN